MHMLILSSLGGGDNNPLPLVLPIWMVIGVIYLVMITVRFIKRKLHRHDDNGPEGTADDMELRGECDAQHGV